MPLRKRHLVAQRMLASSCLGVCLLLGSGTPLASAQSPLKDSARRPSTAGRANRHSQIRVAEKANGRDSQSRGDADASGEEGNAKSTYMREGHKIYDAVGHFSVQGDTISFIGAENGLLLGTLPNLNLERIRADSDANDDDPKWVISGVITEYKNANFILITRVIKKASTSVKNKNAN